MRYMLKRALLYIKKSNKREALKTMNGLRRQYGWKGFFRGIKNKLCGYPLLTGLAVLQSDAMRPKADYDRIGQGILQEQQMELSAAEQKERISAFAVQPKLSILMPIYNAPVKWLEIAILSVQSQSYTNWELCMVDDGSEDTRGLSLIDNLQQKDSRLKLQHMPQNSGISAASNKALSMAEGEYIVLMDQDDELTPDAFFWFVNEINTFPESDILYSDECKTLGMVKPTLTDFYFKPDWSPELLINHMYVGHLTMYRTALVRKLGGFRSEYDFSQDYDLILRASEETEHIRHVERVLYFWRMLPTSGAAGGKDYARISNVAALADAYQRRGLPALCYAGGYANYGFLKMERNPLVSVIIPSDSTKILQKCIQGLTGEMTSYKNLEIIPVTNSKTANEIEEMFSYLSNMHICRYDKLYNFSDKCNCGAQEASGEYLIIYNDDVYPFSRDWVERMLEVLQYPGVGGVSPLMLYEDQRIQYAGMITGVPGQVGTSFNCMPFALGENSPFHHFLMRDVSILSGACMMVRRELYERIGGFDAVNTPTGHSDVDISFKIIEQGLRCVYTPYSVLTHIGNHSWEAKSKQEKAEIYCLKRWGKYMERDPYFTDSMKRIHYSDFNYRFNIFLPQRNLPCSLDTRDILILTHELTRTGAPVILKDLVKVIIENGDYPVIMSPADGALRNEFLEMGCIVLIDESMINGHWMFEHFARNFDLVIANTLGCAQAIKALSDSLPPVIWWVHEGEYAFKHFQSQLPPVIGKNIKIYASIDYVHKLLVKEHLPVEEEIYEYGVCDCCFTEKAAVQSNSAVFAIVGSIERRKGQDIMLQAIERLPDHYKECAEFIFVGNILEYDIFEKIEHHMKKNPNIKYREVMPLNKIYELFQKSICVVVPSRDDPLPVVATEAMMLGKVCICSDHTGTASLLVDQVSGLTFRSEDVDKLSKLIMYVIDHPDKAISIGAAARKVYEQIFTYPNFKNRTIKILQKELKRPQ